MDYEKAEKVEGGKMPELISKITSLDDGMFLLRHDIDAGCIAFEFENESHDQSSAITIYERFVNPNGKYPWEMYVAKNERTFPNVKDGLSKYLVNGIPLKDCVDDAMRLPPGF